MSSLLQFASLVALLATALPIYSAPDDRAGERPAVRALEDDSWTVFRVGGDSEVTATWNEGNRAWVSGNSTIDTPLPEGYPAPTPPGALDLKKYPAVRRAEITGARGDSGSGFMPLFRHISRHDIPMTSPVEVDYRAPENQPLTAGGWTMSFLYRTGNEQPPGADAADARVTVADTSPTLVLSIGGRGSYDTDRVEKDFATLRQWLAENPEWQEAGPGRALFYNGPSFRPWRKWLEVQLPVRPRPSAQK